jgi:uncharacterized protein YbaA (DUF1428 family)
MAYVDGFIVAVPTANKEKYRKHASDAAPLFREFGATRLVEAWADDVPEGKITDFRRAVKATEDEAVVFSWLEYPSKEVRDAANQKMRADPRMKEMGETMPFDGMRMVYGGFAGLLDEGSAQAEGYVDAMVAAVPTDKKEEFRKFATAHSALFREFGAVRVVDAWGDDVPDGKVTDFKGAVQAEDGETVIYSWVEWPSKEVRDQAWGKLMEDPRMQETPMPFDGKRLIHGGFSAIVDA